MSLTSPNSRGSCSHRLWIPSSRVWRSQIAAPGKLFSAEGIHPAVRLGIPRVRIGAGLEPEVLARPAPESMIFAKVKGIHGQTPGSLAIA